MIIELVLNHTSDQHPWFQEARSSARQSQARLVRVERHRHALPGSAASFSWTRKFPIGPGTRFPKSYYWHRFFSHQPDLNFDNPAVFESDVGSDEVLAGHWAWMDSGWTRCRIWWSAKAPLRKLAGNACDHPRDCASGWMQIIPGTMLLAEANQWPADVRAYFGERATNSTWHFIFR